MRVALIGDIHGNLHALNAVLTDAELRKARTIWNTGDSVGIGPFPDEVVKLLQDKHAISVAGNFDLEVLDYPQNAEQLAEDETPEKLAAYRFAYESLSEESRKYLSSLPTERRLKVDGYRILLCHGSPVSIDEALSAESPIERFEELARCAEAEIVIMGHSHEPFVKSVGGVTFINTGSVGRSNDGDPRACYAIFDTRKSAKSPFRVQHYRLKYPVDKAVEAFMQKNLPEAFARVLLEGRSLDWILKRGLVAPVSETDESQAYEERVQKVHTVLQAFGHDEEHSQHVAKLALAIFDQLKSAHRMGCRERFWLECAALLHDIGWVAGRRAHHKTTLRLIIESATLPFDERERLIIGSIARYHRRALPKKRHEHFAMLKRRDRDRVILLSGILRLADGLDCTHQKVVERISCRATTRRVHLQCVVHGDAELERGCAIEKGQLLELALERALKIEMITS